MRSPAISLGESRRGAAPVVESKASCTAMRHAPWPGPRFHLAICSAAWRWMTDSWASIFWWRVGRRRGQWWRQAVCAAGMCSREGVPTGRITKAMD